MPLSVVKMDLQCPDCLGKNFIYKSKAKNPGYARAQEYKGGKKNHGHNVNNDIRGVAYKRVLHKLSRPKDCEI